jgi:hypothetical protein
VTVFKRTGAQLGLLLTLICGIGLAVLERPLSKPAFAQAPQAADMVLGIGICPPWRTQSVEVCRNSVQTVLKAFSERFGLSEARLHLMLNEGASADSLKKTVTALANTLGPEDRLIIYANIPSISNTAAEADLPSGQVLQLWADEKPESTELAIETGTWISAPAFAAMLHTVPAGQVILILDTSNSDTIDPDLLETHATNLDARPEALVTSAGAGQMANYSADRTIALFSKHLAASLSSTEGTLADVIKMAAAGTRQAAIPICVALREKQSDSQTNEKDCTQVPEVHDPAGILSTIAVPPLPEQEAN